MTVTRAMAVSADGSVAAQVMGMRIRVWDAATGE
jgi:hypothetical protein